MTKRRFSPAIEGNLEISHSSTGVFIGGDAKGLRSLGRLLTWLADVDQESRATLAVGERVRIRLHANQPAPQSNSLNSFSAETTLARLDAKSTGKLPDKYSANSPSRKPLGT